MFFGEMGEIALQRNNKCRIWAEYFFYVIIVYEIFHWESFYFFFVKVWSVRVKNLCCCGAIVSK
jgi:hypothetical protein